MPGDVHLCPGLRGREGGGRDAARLTGLLLREPWFARALGEVRDLDVYAENFRTYLQAIPPEQVQDLGGYELHLRRARSEARNDLTELFAD